MITDLYRARIGRAALAERIPHTTIHDSRSEAAAEIKQMQAFLVEPCVTHFLRVRIQPSRARVCACVIGRLCCSFCAACLHSKRVRAWAAKPAGIGVWCSAPVSFGAALPISRHEDVR